MEPLFRELEKITTRGNLSKSLDDVQETIDLLTKAREAVVASRYRNYGVIDLQRASANAIREIMSSVALLTHHDSQDPHGAGITLAKLQTPVKQSFDKVNSDLKEVYNCLGDYSKALGKVLEYHTLFGSTS